MPDHVLFYVNCTYGVGHYRRVELLVRALRARRPGRRITVLTGGPSWPSFDRLGCRVVELPPIVIPSFGPVAPVGADGSPLEDVVARRRPLIDAAAAAAPVGAICFEFFPFSSQFMADEARALVAAVRRRSPAARVVSSVRDIAWNLRMRASPERWRATVEGLTEELIDAVLVHSDAAFLPFEYCWGSTPTFAEKIVHTGVVVDAPRATSPGAGADASIVCSVGGGQDGLPALRLFLQAWEVLHRRQGLLETTNGVVCLGYFGCGAECEGLLRRYAHLFAPDGGTLRLGEWNAGRDLLSGATASVSMCGYNTCYEVLASGIPAIFVPRVDQEQTVRSSLVAGRGWAQVATDADSMVAAFERILATAGQPRRVPPLDFGGSARTAEILDEMLQR